MTSPTYYVFSGNTYANRDHLSSRYGGVGAEWHPDFKVWMLAGSLLDSTVWKLRRLGVKVETSKTAPACWLDRYGDDDAAEPSAPAGCVDITDMSDADLDALLGM